jgi:hypothetical protein
MSSMPSNENRAASKQRRGKRAGVGGAVNVVETDDYTVTPAQTEVLAKSLRVYATIPRAIAEAHMRLRGYEAPGEDATDAYVRGALLKCLVREVLSEREARARGERFDPYVNARGKEKTTTAATLNDEEGTRGRTMTKEQTERAASVETRVIDGGSDSDESVGNVACSKVTEYESPSESESDEEEDNDDDDDDDDDDEYSDDDDDVSGESDGGNYFGRHASEPPAPEGANPFASMDFDPAQEVKSQIAEAKRIVAERDARANELADAIKSLKTDDGALSPTASSRVAFSDKGDDATSVAGSELTDRFDAISIASIAATLGSDAADRVADVEGSEFDAVSLASHGTRGIAEEGSDDERAGVIYESESDERQHRLSADFSDDLDLHHAKENAPPTP